MKRDLSILLTILLVLTMGMVNIKADDIIEVNNDETISSKLSDISSGTIKLNADITDNVVIDENKNIVLDLNGHTLTNSSDHTILNNGNLTIIDSSSDGNGKIVSIKDDTSVLRNGDNAICVIKGGTFYRNAANGNTWHIIDNFGNLTIDNATITLEGDDGFVLVNGWNYFDPGENTKHASLTINNIIINAIGGQGIKNCRYGDLIINNANVNVKYWPVSNETANTANSYAIVNNGTFNSSEVMGISNGGVLTINGGTFTGKTGSLKIQNYALTTVVNGGSFSSDISSYLDGNHVLVLSNNLYKVISFNDTSSIKDNTGVVDSSESTLNSVKDSNTTYDKKNESFDSTLVAKVIPSVSEITNEETIASANSSITDVINSLDDTSYDASGDYTYLNIDLVAYDSNNNTANVISLENKITIKVVLDTSTLTKISNADLVKVARIHDNETTLLDASVENGVLSFETNKFSTYVIVTFDKKKEETKDNTSKKDNNTSSNVTSVKTCEEAIGKDWTWSEKSKTCVYRVTNTNTK